MIKKVLIIIGSLIILGVIGVSIYLYNISPVSKDDSSIELEITENSSYLNIGPKLEKLKLIRSDLFYKIYIKLNNPTNLQAGTYQLNKTMNIKDIVACLEKGSNFNPNAFNVTFKEGLNMRSIAKIISEKTNNTYDSVFTLLSDKTYLSSLVDEYWFITDDILNSKIYYSLEGYLFPNTYSLIKENTVEEIFKLMLEEMDSKLTPYKEQLESNSYSIHELLTLASIIELEAGNADDRNGVAGVFFNRLKANWTLGSDVTTYYAFKKELWVSDLTKAETQACNAYNTRGTCFTGLPVGPISNPGIESIKAVLNPTSHKYYYFVADKNGKTYFNVDNAGHLNTVSRLKSEGLWYEYQS